MHLTVKTGAVSVQFREFNVQHKSLEVRTEERYAHINVSPHHEYLFKAL